MLALKEEYPQIKGIYQKFDVHWGGFSLLQVEMFLLEIAMRDSDADSFHLISGQDYPIVPLTRFLQFFAEAKNLNFIDYCKWPITSWEHPFFDRFRFFYLCDYIEGNSAKGKEFLAKSIHWQKTYGIKREPITEFNIICKGSQWFSLTRQAVTILLDYTYKKKSLYNRLNYTFAPEETYINTVLVNIMDKNLIQNNNLRYIRWMGENGNNPSNLSSNHYQDIIKSGALFARKMEYPYCADLIRQIDEQILNKK